MDLTMFIIPPDNPEESDCARARESVESICKVVHELSDRKIHDRVFHVTTQWYGYIFANEWFDEGLRFALPTFLRSREYDYLILCKKVFEERHQLMTPKMFVAPRLFRKYVELEGEGSLIPKNAADLNWVQVLDGWVLEPVRKLKK